MSEWIPDDKATEVVLDNWWLSADEIGSYIRDRGPKDIKFLLRLVEVLRELDLEDMRRKAVLKAVLRKTRHV